MTIYSYMSPSEKDRVLRFYNRVIETEDIGITMLAKRKSRIIGAVSLHPFESEPVIIGPARAKGFVAIRLLDMMENLLAELGFNYWLISVDKSIPFHNQMKKAVDKGLYKIYDELETDTVFIGRP